MTTNESHPHDQVEQLRTELARLRERVDEQETRIEKQEAKIEKQAERIADQETRIRSQQAEIDRLESELEKRETEIETQVERLAEFESAIEFRDAEGPDDAGIEDVWIAGHPLGLIAEKNKRRSREAVETAKEARRVVEEGSEKPSEHPDRSEWPPIFKMWMDVRDGDTEKLLANDRRAARLFGDFIDNADPSGHTMSYSSGQARRHLEEVGDITAGDSYKTVQRAMERVARYSSQEGEEPLVTFDSSRGTNYLAADKDDWQEFVKQVKGSFRRDEPGSAARTDVDGDDPGSNRGNLTSSSAPTPEAPSDQPGAIADD